MDLSGKTVIITGASRGIGEAAARHLAELGAGVVLAARSGEAISKIASEINAAGGAASPAQVVEVGCSCCSARRAWHVAVMRAW